MAFDSQGDIYVASALTSRVIKFGADESFLFSFTGGGLSSPMGIARDSGDVLHVAGGGSNNIVRFDTAGTYLGQLSHFDLTGPQGVAIDDRGHLFSSSYYQRRLVEFDATGAYVQTITAGDLRIPRGIAFASANSLPVPALSGWGLAVLAAALLAARRFIVRWRRPIHRIAVVGSTPLKAVSRGTPPGWRELARQTPEWSVEAARQDLPVGPLADHRTRGLHLTAVPGQKAGVDRDTDPGKSELQGTPIHVLPLLARRDDPGHQLPENRCGLE